MTAPSRSIDKITISFGLVSVPVKVYSATTDAPKGIALHIISRNGKRAKQRLVADDDAPALDQKDALRGHEFAKGQYVTFTPDELRALKVPVSEELDIEQFVPLTAIDPVYFKKTYFLAPDKGADKPYALLLAALQNAKKYGIGRWKARGNAHVVALRATGRVITMQLLRFASEVRDAVEVEPRDVNAKELQLAMKLIDARAAKWEPSAWKDEHQERLKAAIESKIKRKQITVDPGIQKIEVGKGAQVIDLMQALRASLPRRRKVS